MSWHHRVGWLEPQASAYWFGRCQDQIVWEQPLVRVYGKSPPRAEVVGFSRGGFGVLSLQRCDSSRPGLARLVYALA